MLKKTKVEKVVAKTTIAPKSDSKVTLSKVAPLKPAAAVKTKKVEEISKVVAKIAPKKVTKIEACPVKKVEAAPVCQKPCKKETEQKENSPAENLKKFAASTLSKDFVKKNNGRWNHQLWMEFCATVVEKGYSPINFNEVGLVLEKEKAAYFAAIK